MNGLVIAVGITIVLLVLTFASAAGRNLAAVRIDGDSMTLMLRGLNKVWGMRSEIAVPISSIKGARVTSDSNEIKPKGLKFPGTAIPGLIYAGTFVRSGGKSFFAIRDVKDAVIIELENQPFDRLIFQTEDPHGTVERIKASTPALSP